MMKCRLLCALLVLALCCCPSVCAEHSETVSISDSVAERNAASFSATASRAPPGTSQSGPQDMVSAAESREVDGDIGGASGSETQSDGATDNSQKHDNDDTTGPQGSKNKSADQTYQNGEDPAATTTTTTTTMAPTTTTTAPQAPSTTTTEAPTTTSTRAPSRLRRIDGGLSSSAWMCAPLLLAVSALAYTTVG
ncbi:putative mucin TcMUCII [Trypanosoma cruzi]|uniref:Mucin TcMUCII, putative n=2 Tax=Trypanosoma cruzi TaxID=5693 RepID=Q4CS77_TRYCC|nr:mucin TcMUCII, putative [Trypanosoma cruzi]EAN83127.1 mucin TcMUCII, putative [Trypanosoma cruzi]PWV06204.1 putative mucin TcMUCII [Trypanosoma cruzi]|eukprot:XP_804978.1 mucin TcMUCII [Trypanosoma cruzi strain CL Brener]